MRARTQVMLRRNGAPPLCLAPCGGGILVVLRKRSVTCHPPFGSVRALTFNGSLCALVTPFDAAGALDLAALSALVEWHADAGTQGLVLVGSTGESGALDESEYVSLIAAGAAAARGRLPIIAGCGAAATHRSLRLMRLAREQGAVAALVVTPFYVRPTQEGLFRHYAALADSGLLPVIMYNVPARTGCDLLPETVARLIGRAGIVGVKEARPEAERMQALLELRQPGFSVLSGDDPTATRALLAGADGVISVAANVVPARFRHLCDAARRGAASAAEALDAELGELYRVLGLEPNPTPVKWLLAAARRIDGTLRLPLLPLSESKHAAASACLAVLARIEPQLQHSA